MTLMCTARRSGGYNERVVFGRQEARAALGAGSAGCSTAMGVRWTGAGCWEGAESARPTRGRLARPAASGGWPVCNLNKSSIRCKE